MIALPHTMNITVTYSLLIHEIISANTMLSHTLAIGHGDSLVSNMQYYHSQTVVVMNQS